MASLLKDIYSYEFLSAFADLARNHVPSLNKKNFLNNIFDSTWQSKELKARTIHVASVLKKYLPNDFDEAAKILTNISKQIASEVSQPVSFAYMILPQYIELYGLNYYEASVRAIEQITQLISCEFCVRPLILKYPNQMMGQMMNWATHPSDKVRRLASEGCRPALPWGMALPLFKKDPSEVLQLLELLKADSSPWVRLSVANNLNDISKLHPEKVIDIAYRWKNISKDTDAIIKHACRTLLKAGHPRILDYYGLNSDGVVELSNFEMPNTSIEMGKELSFSFQLANISDNSQKTRIEYAIYFIRQNNKHSKKVFQISERLLLPSQKIMLSKKHSFRPITTRKYYVGEQFLAIIVNGKEICKQAFSLI